MSRPLTATFAGVAVLVAGGVGIAAASPDGGAATGHAALTPPSTVVAATPSAATALVLVSGRDDHGELASPAVALYSAPAGRMRVGRVPDGTLARVVASVGTWLQVSTVEGKAVQGWVDDFYLRRQVHLVGPAPTCRTRLSGKEIPAGEQAVVLEVRDGRARVQLVRTAAGGWVSRATVQELAPAESCSGTPTAAP